MAKGEMIDNEVQRVAAANLEVAESLSRATEVGRRQIERAANASSNGSEGDDDARLSLSLQELAFGNLQTIRAACDSLAVASRRAASINEPNLLESGLPAPPQESGGSKPGSPSVASTPAGGPPEDTGGLRPLLQAISSHRRIVVLTTLAALVGAVALLAIRQPTYEATANVLVQPVPQDDPTYLSLGVVRDSGDPVRTTQTAATLLDSTEAADLTAQKMGGDWTSKMVQDSVEVAPISESNIIAITGSAGSAEESARLADTFAETSLAARDGQLEKQVDAAIEQTQNQLDATDPADPNATQLSNELGLLSSIKQSGDPSLELQ